MIKNIDKINIIKRDKVKRGLEYIEKNSKGLIDKIFIFGSAVTDDCTEESDIDICFNTTYDCTNRDFFYLYGTLPLEMNDLCDIIILDKADEKLKKEILTKGVEVYEY